jgi:hypothetical protein
MRGACLRCRTLKWIAAPFWILEAELNFGKVAPEPEVPIEINDESMV